MKKIRKIYPKKAEVNALELKAVVIEKPVIVEWGNGFDFKAKTTAKVKSLNTNKIIDFVVWKKFEIAVGDEIFSLGKVESTGKAFIGWAEQTKIIKRATQD